jgi:hypothetical protein
VSSLVVAAFKEVISVIRLSRKHTRRRNSFNGTARRTDSSVTDALDAAAGADDEEPAKMARKPLSM